MCVCLRVCIRSAYPLVLCASTLCRETAHTCILICVCMCVHVCVCVHAWLDNEKYQCTAPQESVLKYPVSIICPIPGVWLWRHNTASTKFMEEVYWHILWQETARGGSSKPALCPACIMVDLHIEYASVNLTVTSGEADTVNQNKCCENSFITSFTYGTLRRPVMKHGTDISLHPHLTEEHSAT